MNMYVNAYDRRMALNLELPCIQRFLELFVQIRVA
ncbi:hypothetical protein LA5095_03660 [Roseibium album]|uniref:Uncharacterized protein n=1 Tax=Roseibium album TaxID=311410 RepID=A0A0M6ZCJ1_9HYPH|nr:hypothetical protein LA5094_02601 [Roseibium album]CTQ76446.1 hypothetical protein LA5095_03660 [Roseibium album]CTQ76934.1 hypothetical protein LA5096_04942 [Roseibium album]